jgi:hypothetical protein
MTLALIFDELLLKAFQQGLSAICPKPTSWLTASMSALRGRADLAGQNQ